MIETVENLRAVPISFSGGVDEVCASDSLEPGDAVTFLNWRLSKDGKRIQKRAGLYEEYAAFAEDVYGHSTYVNSALQFCQVAVLESKVMRSVAGAAWSNILAFSSNIDHAVKPLEINGKQFIITEKGSRVILPDGTVRQIGISRPTAIPSALAAYAGSSTPPVNDLMNYADQAAMNAVWIDNDSGTSASTLDTTDPDGVPGPGGDSRYMRLLQGGATTAGAKRTRSLMGVAIGQAKYSAEVVTYFDVLSETGVKDGFRVKIDNAVFDLTLYIAKDGVWLNPRNGLPLRAIDQVVPVNKWITWNFTVDATDLRATVFNIFMSYDGLIKAQNSITYYPSATAGVQKAELYTYRFSSVNTDVHVDRFKIYQAAADMAQISGLYRYAVSFVRTGDYGCESNPIKSSIGAITFSGTGPNDMTLDPDSEYTGALSKVIRVKVKVAASPQDTIQWSEDGGQTWSGEIKLASKVHLGHGITVNFAAITGHVLNDYWQIPCNCCSAVATMQQITISGIQGSLDEQVTARKLYRTTRDGSKFYYLTTIYDRNVTTEFVDNFPDSTLGDEMEEDRDVMSEISSTIGKCSELWDDRLWVADHAENVVYYSASRSGGGVHEEFDMLSRFIPVKRGVQGDTITAMKAFKDALYIFKRNDIYIVQKNVYGYGIYHLNSDVGCIADNCVEQVNDYLAFPSERGLELHDGMRPYSPDFAVAVSKTFLTADPAGIKYISIVHDKEYNELWLSIPSRTGGAAAITQVWNYIRNKFYFFQFHKTPSCLVSCKDSTGKRVVKMGTRDGTLALCDYGTQDGTTNITATYRKGWLDMEAHGIARLLKVDYEVPSSSSILVRVYKDMQKAHALTNTLSGDTPTDTDKDIRRVIGDKIELGTRARWLSVEFINSGDAGGDCKLNQAFMMVRPDVIKRRIDAD